MDVRQLCHSLKLEPVAGANGMDKEVNGAFAGDLLSYIMANAAKGNVWLTIQAHSNIVAVACLLELACIIVTGGVQVDSDTLEKADREGIPILSADQDVYTLCCKLHGLGI
jgi:predicted transcriptional regulator